MEPQISIIIPVFNTAPFISRCCRSLFGQSMKELQFIFVDDGSVDGSIDLVHSILSEYPDRADQTLFLSQEHQGVSAARQLGLSYATGEYIIHCDSDDWVEPQAYEELYRVAKGADADIVNFGYYIDNKDRKKFSLPTVKDFCNEVDFSIAPNTGSIWSKLIRRQLIQANQLSFPSGINWGEDLCFSLQALLLSRCTITLDKPLYHYIQQPTSITHTITPQRCAELVRCGELIQAFLQNHHLSEEYAFQLNWLKFQLKQYYLIFPHLRDINRWQSLYPECHSSISQYDCAFYLKVVSWLILHHMKPIASIVLKLRDQVSALK